MAQLRERSLIQRFRIRSLVTGAAMLIVVGVGSDLHAQCRGGRAGGGQVAGRAGGPPGMAMGGGFSQGASVNQMAQMMQMLQQAQQLQAMQRQAAMMQQARGQQELQARQRQTQSISPSATTTAALTGESSTLPTMPRKERLRRLIQQRREAQTEKKLSRRELAIQRSARKRASSLVASAGTDSATIGN